MAQLGKTLKQITPNLDNKNDMHKFFIEVHNGWKIAQKKIKNIALEIYEEIKSIELLIKKAQQKTVWIKNIINIV